MHYPSKGYDSSPRGRWGICALSLPEVLTITPSGNNRQIRLTQPRRVRKGIHRNPERYV
jgi:hypothetical protein